MLLSKKTDSVNSLPKKNGNSWATFGLSTLIFGAAFGIGLGTGTAATFSNLEYAQETMRGGGSDLAKENDKENNCAGHKII